VNLANIKGYDAVTVQMLLRLLNERGKNQIPFHDVVCNLYPDRDYYKVYSTVSTSISRLEGRNIVRRKSMGNRTYISFTPEALRQLSSMKMNEYLKKIGAEK
jgi:predicted transcriptional regulator